ncbi:MAG: TenA family transcriptional regulator [Nitrospiraceae bacterium]
MNNAVIWPAPEVGIEKIGISLLAETPVTTDETSPKPAASPKNPKAWISEDPAWIFELKQHLDPYRHAVLNCRLIREASDGTLPLAQMRGWLLQLYPFIECFPKWLALSLARTQDPVSQAFLIDNLRVEKKHALQWIHMAEAFGVSEQELMEVKPLPGVEALTHWLWSINSHGVLVEAVAATNYSIEGVTQGIAQSTVLGFPKYEGREGIHLSKKAYAWMEAHARYDDLHPVYALEIIKRYSETQEMRERVKFAAQRSLEFMLMALEACYTHYSTGYGPTRVETQESSLRRCG